MSAWRFLVSVGRTGAAALLLAVSACSSNKEGSTQPTSAASTTRLEVTTTTAAATTSAVPTTDGATGEATLDAPAEVGAGEKFDVKWTGPNVQGDYITIVAAGTAKWTNEPWFYTMGAADPGSLVAPVEDGAYELWYVDGETDAIMVRRAIRVTPFEGALGAAAEVPSGSEFEVTWRGPDGPGDYVTIVAVGTTKWTNESYFYTNVGSPGVLVAPVEPGEYELWYVTAADGATMATRPITVVASLITLDAPDRVNRGATFEVAWTGPDGPQDYITIVPAGSPAGTYLSYAYTASGNPVTLTAPTDAGPYEIWYASDRVAGTFFSIPIVVD